LANAAAQEQVETCLREPANLNSKLCRTKQCYRHPHVTSSIAALTAAASPPPSLTQANARTTTTTITITTTPPSDIGLSASHRAPNPRRKGLHALSLVVCAKRRCTNRQTSGFCSKIIPIP
jgi:hypothetical protein